MSDPVYFDSRWSGDHGIGRFATEMRRWLPGLEPLRILGPKLSLIDPLAISMALAAKRRGIYFSPGFNPPLVSPIPVIFTIHDLIHLKVPEESSPLRILYYATVVRPAARRGWPVLTVSAYSRADIAEWVGIPEEAIHVVGNGISEAFRPEGKKAVAQAPYFLHVGRRAGHKNIPRLLAAFARSRAAQTHLLMFTGQPDRPTLEVAASLGIAARLRFAGSLDDEALAARYRGAVALLFPSLYEGFGLPIVEAMACGAPVLSSTTTATAEVAGDDNALLLPPLDEDALKDGIDRLAEDAALRSRLAERGLRRAAAFSWPNVAARVQDALEACQ